MWIQHSRNRNSTETTGDITPLFLAGYSTEGPGTQLKQQEILHLVPRWYPTAGTGTPLKQQDILHLIPSWIRHSWNRNFTETTGDITPCS
jgi:hypothetical protein